MLRLEAILKSSGPTSDEPSLQQINHSLRQACGHVSIRSIYHMVLTILPYISSADKVSRTTQTPPSWGQSIASVLGNSVSRKTAHDL